PLFIAVVVVAAAPALTWSRRLLWIMIVLAAAGATGLAHPSALLGAVALVVPFLVMRLWTTARRAGPGTRATLLVALCVGLVGLIFIWIKANVTTNAWLPSETMAQALGEVVMLSPVERTAGLL